MAQNDTSRAFELRDITAALGLLSRLPVPVNYEYATARGAKAVWAYPLVGVVIGALAGVIGTMALWAGLPPLATAALMIAVSAITTGVMHEDGLADSADGLWGGWDKHHRLKIMKDSFIGVYGVVAVGLSLILRITLLAALIGPNNLFILAIGIGALSRTAMPPLMHWLPNAREEGLSASVGAAPRLQTLTACGVGSIIALGCFGLSGIAVLTSVAIVAVLWAMIAHAKIQGQTGDILGASQQLAEIASLLTLCAVLL